MIENKNLPKVTQPFPFEVELEAGKLYKWCTCGLTKAGPYCDNAHREIEDTPYRSNKFEVAEGGTYWLCGCKQTKNPPFCDGSHKSL